MFDKAMIVFHVMNVNFINNSRISQILLHQCILGKHLSFCFSPLYICAFKVKFSQFEQKILAAQAPKKNMVSGFWQMVLDNNVTVIVMITKLLENNVVKADQYWPTQDEDCLELENSIKVIFKSESADKGLIRRVFGVSNGGKERSVTLNF